MPHIEVDPEDLWDAQQCVQDWRDSANCDDTPEHRERLTQLAKRIRDAVNRAYLETDFRSRLVEEHAQLSDRLSKLDAFLNHNAAFGQLPTIERDALRDQFHHMCNYCEVLTGRLDRLTGL